MRWRGHTWARIPHFFGSPYYVYQYATCFASTARLMQDIRSSDAGVAADGVERYLSLLRAGGSDFPMKLLAQAGVRPGPAGHGPGGVAGAGRAGRRGWSASWGPAELSRAKTLPKRARLTKRQAAVI